METTINILQHGDEFFLRARLDVTVPGVRRELALELVDTAHEICPYSKAVKGNVEVDVNLVQVALA